MFNMKQFRIEKSAADSHYYLTIRPTDPRGSISTPAGLVRPTTVTHDFDANEIAMILGIFDEIHSNFLKNCDQVRHPTAMKMVRHNFMESLYLMADEIIPYMGEVDHAAFSQHLTSIERTLEGLPPN